MMQLNSSPNSQLVPSYLHLHLHVHLHVLQVMLPLDADVARNIMTFRNGQPLEHAAGSQEWAAAWERTPLEDPDVCLLENVNIAGFETRTRGVRTSQGMSRSVCVGLGRDAVGRSTASLTLTLLVQQTQ